MAGIVGGEILLRRGYSPGQVYALQKIAEAEDRTVTIGEEPGATTLQWSRPGVRDPIPYDAGGYQPHREAGIKTSHLLPNGKFMIDSANEPPRTNLTENETLFVLPVVRPGNERIEFNPVQVLNKGQAARGYFSYDTAPSKKYLIDFQPLTRKDILPLVKRLEQGKSIPQLWKWGGQEPQVSQLPKSSMPKVSNVVKPIFNPKNPFNMPVSIFQTLFNRGRR